MWERVRPTSKSACQRGRLYLPVATGWETVLPLPTEQAEARRDPDRSACPTEPPR